jgi:LPXTG-motif cell wall-anchored protein
MVKRMVGLALVLVAIMAAPVAAQQYPPGNCGLTVSDTTPIPGQTITITAFTFEPNAQVSITLGSNTVVLGTPTANASGVVTLQATIPSDTKLGHHTITATGPSASCAATITAAITVVPKAAAGAGGPPSGPLPRTGDDTSIPLAKIGLGLAAVGGVLTAFAAKRRKAAAATSA